MANTYTNKHLTLEDRQNILKGIINNQSKTEIANYLQQHKSTIGKEIAAHRQLQRRCPLKLPCANYKHCKHGRSCTTSCSDYVMFKCSRRDRSPGACNGCEKHRSCRFDQYYYHPDLAHKEYKSVLRECRTGVNATYNELRELGLRIKPLLDQGLSIYHITKAHPDIGVCEKTLYNYIDDLVFKQVGVDINAMNLRRKVSRRPPKKRKNLTKKRKDRSFLVGRTYNDYTAFVNGSEDPVNVVQMDTVYNDATSGPFIQTFKFLQYDFLFAILHSRHDSQAMIDGVDQLEELLGRDLFRTEVEALLTDRGGEFVKADRLETGADGLKRTNIFYCDPMQSGQKGSLENHHIMLRYILPKNMNFRESGLNTQDDLNLVLSHVNSNALKKLNGRSSMENLQFLNPELYKRFVMFGVRMIDKDKVILTPSLLKR